MNSSLFKGKSTRTKIFTAITAVGILLLLVFNLLMTALGMGNNLYIDTTREGFYTLSDKMVNACNGLFGDLPAGKSFKITFCADPDTLIASGDLRASYFMALNLQKRYPEVMVETVNVNLNPTAVSAYKTTSRAEIASTDIIFSYGARYRIVAGKSLWMHCPDFFFFFLNKINVLQIFFCRCVPGPS